MAEPSSGAATIQEDKDGEMLDSKGVAEIYSRERMPEAEGAPNSGVGNRGQDANGATGGADRQEMVGTELPVRHELQG